MMVFQLSTATIVQRDPIVHVKVSVKSSDVCNFDRRLLYQEDTRSANLVLGNSGVLTWQAGLEELL